MYRRRPVVLLLFALSYAAGSGELDRTQRLLPTDPADNRRFGQSLALTADSAAVAASGRVIVYERDYPRPGLWGEAAVLRADAPGFGKRVALSTAGLAVAAPDGENGGQVHRYRNDHTGRWQRQETLQAPDGGSGDRFGAALAADGEWLAVGAPGADVGGAVFLYRCQAHCTLIQRVADPQGEFQADYGASLAMAGDWLAVGAPARDVTPFQGRIVPAGDLSAHAFAIAKGDAPFCGEDVGVVYLYRLSELAAGATAPAATLAPEDAECLQGYGAALALRDGKLAVGSPGKDVGDTLSAGVVYLYGYDGSRWQPQLILASDHPSEDGRFGAALAWQGKRLLVGAPRETGHRFRTGVVHRFSQTVEVWQDTPLELAQGQTYDLFGASLAVAGEDLWIGAPGRRLGESAAGAVFRTGSPAPPPSARFNFGDGRLILDGVGIWKAGQSWYRAVLTHDLQAPGWRFRLQELTPTEAPAHPARYLPDSGRLHVPSVSVRFSDGHSDIFTVDLRQIADTPSLTFQLETVR
ncbi:hypothetical protein MIT9_P1071 [Methylomarinovum caldicuralii]|uniref:Uncharacterized protein n=1 Tax=Methylomarinovum caldicuralii TaxID=438856 RepID=A0AAU9C1N1_9GAMM|nr:FG-GAP repeat protein [Methylomarinovum caldicuralii]BCX81493.1 hypothetical protein MIT9_P1071 [Methylomarinovum caldicuralii]